MTDDLRNRISRIVHDARRSNEGSDIIADRILAEVGAVRVKPLVWDESIGQVSYFSATFIGEYRATKTQNTRNDKWQVTYLDPNRRSHTIGYIEGFEPAKAAAQADYEARILAAIEPAPVGLFNALTDEQKTAALSFDEDESFGPDELRRNRGAQRCAECDCDSPPDGCNWIAAGPAPGSVREAARVLLPVFERRHGTWAVSKGRNPADYTSPHSATVDALRAIAEGKE